MKKRIIISLSCIIVIATIITVVAITAFGTGNAKNNEAISTTKAPPTVAAEKSAGTAKDRVLKDVDGDEWFKEYYADIKMQYSKGNDETKNNLIDKMNSKIDEFYADIKTGVTEEEYNAFESEIYMLKSKIDGTYNSSGAMKAPSAKYDTLESVKAKLLAIKDELEQYVLDHEAAKKESKGRYKTVEPRLKKAYAFRDKLEDAIESVGEDSTMSLADANKLVKEMDDGWYDVRTFDGVE